MEELILLGTGNAQATNCYNTCFAIRNGNEYLLVDAGGGNQILNQLKKANIELEQIHTAILTHAHTDHILGMVWIYRMVATSMEKGIFQGDFVIYSHNEAKEILEYMITKMLPAKFAKLLGTRIHLEEVRDGEVRTILGKEVSFFDIHSTKMKQFGFYTKLPQGKLVCFGDEPCKPEHEDIMKDAYFVLLEAFCLYADREIFKPYEKHHTTVKDAAEQAAKCNVQNLLLYHTEDKHMESRKARYTEEAENYCKCRIFIPEDLERITL
ncbi:MAG: MBL fold metallo-hydrolase [Lachnospiraceae bacterium]|nr:MBL fold metallo-hydrolase [Lachnospiraceae bacterium]